MSIIQPFNLNLIPDSSPVVVHVDQYDHGEGRFSISLYEGKQPYTPSGSIVIQGTKPDGRGFAYSCTNEGNLVTADLTEQMTAVAGPVRAQIVVTEETGRTGTFAFMIDVQRSALPDGSDMSQSEIAILQQYAEEAMEGAGDAEAWSVGTRGGVPVSPSDPAYNNYSKWWAEHGGAAGVRSFNGRNGSVLPMAGDYTDNMIILASSMHIGGETQTDVQEALQALSQHGGGLFPYLYIDSEPESVVTVTTPSGGTITPTAAGSGHWECSLPSYGVYVIHSVLNGDDATFSLTVDDVKEYHVTDSHYDFTINVTAQLGATIRVQAGQEIYTETGTGSPVAIVVHQASTQYTVEATLDGYSDSETVTSAATTGQSTSVTLHIFTATLHITTTSEELAGATITITKGGTTIGTTSFPASGTLEADFTVHETGSYTASVTYSGETFSDTQPVSTETTVNFNIVTVPDGSTVLPTDDIETWLACAGLSSLSYTTLNEVLADHEALYILMENDNAVDYLVRSTTWATDITSDEYAMKYIGKWNYCSDTLLDDSTWRAAIVDSTYFESVLNAKIPDMTSNTEPSGTASAGYTESGRYPYTAFDGDTATGWGGSNATQSTVLNNYIMYEFPSTRMIAKVIVNAVKGTNAAGTITQYIQTHNPDTDEWENYADDYSLTTSDLYTITKKDWKKADKIRIKCKSTFAPGSTYLFYVREVQAYGRTDVTENLIDVYGAASDTISITGNDISLVVETDTTGYGSIAKSSLPNGTYTFTSLVGQDPSNLSNAYSKSITITDTSVVDGVYVMPDTCLYWYGYKNNLETINTTNGWSGGTVNPVYNRNNLTVTAPSAGYGGVGTALAVRCTNAHTIGKSVAAGATTLSMKNPDKTSTSNPTGQIADTVTHVTVAASEEKDFYIGIFPNNGRVLTLYAFWYD